MNSENFYYRIYEKKASAELVGLAMNQNIAIDTRNLAIEILENRGELNDELISLKAELENTRLKLLRSEISTDKYDTFWARVAANAIDNSFLKILGFGSVLFISDSFIMQSIVIASYFLPYVYSILFHAYFGQTIGKMLMGIKIFNKNEITQISLKQAVLRDCIPLIFVLIVVVLTTSGLLKEESGSTPATTVLSVVILTWAILEIFTLLFNQKRRALHDFVAGTVVLKIKDR